MNNCNEFELNSSCSSFGQVKFFNFKLSFFLLSSQSTKEKELIFANDFAVSVFRLSDISVTKYGNVDMPTSYKNIIIDSLQVCLLNKGPN